MRREPALRHQRTLQVLGDITARTREAARTARYEGAVEQVHLVAVDRTGGAPLVRLVVDDGPAASSRAASPAAVPVPITLAAAATTVVGGLGIVAAILR